MPTKPTKAATVLKMLGRPNGATIEQLQKVTAWQPHSIRAAITGLRKNGNDVRHNKNAKGVTIYSVVNGS